MWLKLPKNYFWGDLPEFFCQNFGISEIAIEDLKTFVTSLKMKIFQPKWSQIEGKILIYQFIKKNAKYLICIFMNINAE